MVTTLKIRHFRVSFHKKRGSNIVPKEIRMPRITDPTWVWRGIGMSRDNDYLLMPWNEKTEMIIKRDLFGDEVISRWNFIKRQLHQSNKILNTIDLIDMIKSYNITYDDAGKKLMPQWKFSALLQYFEEIGESEKNNFFREGGILSTIRILALKCPELVPKVKLLKSGFEATISLHQLQIASLLANAFLCTYPKQEADYPSINFHTLFNGPGKGNLKTFVEKIKCIIHYFQRINEKQPEGNVSYHRLCILDHKLPRWDRTTATLCGLKVEIQGKIEDQEGFLQMDFANRFVGGGVLGRGCVQEEIRFVICPELIAARLFTQCLADNEALFVLGAERYCKYSGFSESFRFDGDYRDMTPFDEDNHRKTYVIVLDALYFNHSSEQYRESKILRELKKAYVGFKPTANSCSIPLATGNWGCGAFRGDPQLKSVLQLMASSQARRDILYLTFGDTSLKKQIDDLYKLLKEHEVNVGTLYRIIRLYNRNKNKNQTLFDFIHEMVTNYRKCTEKLSNPSNLKTINDSKIIGVEMEKDCGSIEKSIRTCSVSNMEYNSDSSGRDSDGNNLLGYDNSFENSRGFSARVSDIEQTASNLDTSYESPSKWMCTTENCPTGNQSHDSVISSCSNVPNLPFFASKKNTTSKSGSYPIEHDRNITEVPAPSLLSRIDAYNQNQMSNELCATAEIRDGSGRVSLGHRHKLYTNNSAGVTAKTRKLTQPKITDCFVRK